MLTRKTFGWFVLAGVPLLCGVPAFCQNAYFLPYVPDGLAGDRILRTSIVLANVGPNAANATITWTNGDGSPRTVALVELGPVSTASVIVPAGSTRRFVTSGSGDGSAGAATVTADSFLSVASTLIVHDGADVPIGESTVFAPEALPSERLVFESSDGSNTGVALMNPGTSSADVSATLRNAAGEIVQSDFITLGAGGRMEAWTGSGLFPGLGEVRGGTLEIESATPVAAVGMQRRSDTSAGIVFPVADPSSRRLKFTLPQIADGQGVARVVTRFLVSNLSSESASVRISFQRGDGSAWSVGVAGKEASDVFAEQLAPGTSAIWETSGLGEYAKEVPSCNPPGPWRSRRCCGPTMGRGSP